MKVLHTADLHLNGGPETDAAKALDQIAEIAHDYDYVHINGDIFDKKSTPEQRLIFKEFLSVIPHSFVIRGNHDEAEDLKVFHDTNRVLVAEKPQWMTHCDKYHVLAIPHFNAGGLAATVANQRELGEEGTNLFDDAIEGFINEAHQKEGVKVLVFHGVVSGARLDNDYIPRENGIHLRAPLLNTFPGLCVGGHFHKYQNVLGDGSVWYSGSPTRHSFGEIDDKGVISVEYNDEKPGEPPTVSFVKLPTRPIWVLGCEFKDGQVVWDDPLQAEAAKAGGDVKVKCRVSKEDVAAMKASDFMDCYAGADVLKFEPDIKVAETVRCEEIRHANTVEAALKLWLQQTGYENGDVTRLIGKFNLVNKEIA